MTATRTRRQPRRPALAITPLEDRSVPATYQLGGLTFEAEQFVDTYNGATATGQVTVGITPGTTDPYKPLLSLYGDVTLVNDVAPWFDLNGSLAAVVGQVDSPVGLTYDHPDLKLLDGGLYNFDVNKLLDTGTYLHGNPVEVARVPFVPDHLRLDAQGQVVHLQGQLRLPVGDLTVGVTGPNAVLVTDHGPVLTGVDPVASGTVSVGGLTFQSPWWSIGYNSAQVTGHDTFTVTGPSGFNLGNEYVAVTLGGFTGMQTPTTGLVIADGALKGFDFTVDGGLPVAGQLVSPKDVVGTYEPATPTMPDGFRLNGTGYLHLGTIYSAPVTLGDGTGTGGVYLHNGTVTTADLTFHQTVSLPAGGSAGPLTLPGAVVRLHSDLYVDVLASTTRGDTLTVLSAPGGVLIGNFSNFPGGARFVTNGRLYQVGYTATDLTLTDVSPAAPVVSPVSGVEDKPTRVVIQRDPLDGPEVAYFQVTGITGGLLFLGDGQTPVTDGTFVTAADGTEGLMFAPKPDANTPAGGSFGFLVRAALDASGTGLSDATPAGVTVAEANDAPTAGTDGLSDLPEDGGVRVISFAELLGNDAAGPANESQQHLVVIAVANAVGGTVTIEGNAIQFTPDPDYYGHAGFEYTIQDDGTTAGTADPRSATGHVQFYIAPVADTPSVTDATAVVNTMTTDGLVITQNPADAQGHGFYRISNIRGGTLYRADGMTWINDGDFISIADGAAGLRFRPYPFAMSPHAAFGFDVQASVDGTLTGLGGQVVTATITVTDPLPPDTIIVAGPAAVTADPWAHFQYHGWDNFDGSKVRFEQNLDGTGWLPVGASLSMFNLADGPHTLWVRAVDSNGNTDPTPAEYQWTVDTAAPAVTILGPSVGYAPAGGTVTYTVVVEDPNLATNGLSAGDIVLHQTGTANAVVSVAGFKGTYTVTLSDLTGHGTLAISVNVGAAADLAGNRSAGVAPSSPVVVDETAPVVTISAPSVVRSKAGPVGWLVTVADDHLPAVLTPGQIELVTKPGTITGRVTVTPVGSNRFLVTVRDIRGEAGTLGIRLPAGWVTDQAGNPSAEVTSGLAAVGTPHKLRVHVAPPPVVVAPGSTHRFVIGYRNRGREAAAGSFLEVTLPANATFNPAASTPGWTAMGNGKYRLDLGTVAPGPRQRVKFAVTFDRLSAPARQFFRVSISDEAANGLPLMSHQVSTFLARGRMV